MAFVLGVLLGFVLGYYIRLWPRVYRRFRQIPAPEMGEGRIACILYDKEELVEHSRFTMRSYIYPPMLYRPHGKTQPTRYAFQRVESNIGIYREVK
jgi:hypothetical protein